MSAQRSSQLATSSQASSPQTSRGDQRSQQSALSRQSSSSSLPSLLLNPFGFFDEDPFSVIRRMQRELNRAFSQSGTTSSRGDDLSNVVWVPPVEVALQDNNFVVSAELPGLSDEDVTVEIRDDAVVIQGERQVEQDSDQGGIRRTERRYGRFYREIPLPDGADPEQATAEITNGVLQIRVPITEAQSNVRQIPVQATSSAQSGSSRTGDQTSSSSGSSSSGSSQSGSSQSTEQKSPSSSSGQKAA